MNILMTGCGTSVGAYIRDQINGYAYEESHVFGVGMHGPDFYADFESEDSAHILAEDAFDRAASHFGGRIDALVLNAGITHIDFVRDHSPADFERVVRMNLVIPYAFAQQMCERATRIHRIVFISSMGAHKALRASPGYVASKCGLEGLAKVISKEYAGNFPSVIPIVVAPAAITCTGMTEQVINEVVRTRNIPHRRARDEVYNSTPMGRPMTHEEVWAMVRFALYDAPEYMSGAVLTAPGGIGI